MSYISRQSRQHIPPLIEQSRSIRYSFNVAAHGWSNSAGLAAIQSRLQTIERSANIFDFEQYLVIKFI
jgi:hypothetical protein